MRAEGIVFFFTTVLLWHWSTYIIRVGILCLYIHYMREYGSFDATTIIYNYIHSNNKIIQCDGEKENTSFFFIFCYSSERIYTSFIAVKRRRVKIIVFSGGDGGWRRETSATERPVVKVTGVNGGAVPGVEEEVPEAWTLFNLKRIIHTRATQTDGPRSFSA